MTGTIVGWVLGLSMLMAAALFFGGALLLLSTVLWPATWVSALVCGCAGGVAGCMVVGSTM
jgi:hypothetical protein